MNEALGTHFARDLTRSLGPEQCVAGFNEQLQTENPEGFSALEAGTESSGADDELFRMIAPAANGEIILALDVSGRLTASAGDASPPNQSSKPIPALDRWTPPRGGGFTHHSARDTPRGAVAQTVPDLEVSAAFFSVRLQRTVSSVTMRYSGSSVKDGLRRLADELVMLYPNAVCRPWNWGHVRVVHEEDSAGLALPRFHLVRTD
jgi:hypothetical protein